MYKFYFISILFEVLTVNKISKILKKEYSDKSLLAR